MSQLSVQELAAECLALPDAIQKAEECLLRHTRDSLEAEEYRREIEAKIGMEAPGANEMQRKAYVTLNTVVSREAVRSTAEAEQSQRIYVDRLKRRFQALLVVVPLLAAKGD